MPLKRVTKQLKKKLREQNFCDCGQPIPEDIHHRFEHAAQDPDIPVRSDGVVSVFFRCCDCFDTTFGMPEGSRSRPRLYLEETEEETRARESRQNNGRSRRQAFIQRHTEAGRGFTPNS